MLGSYWSALSVTNVIWFIDDYDVITNCYAQSLLAHCKTMKVTQSVVGRNSTSVPVFVAQPAGILSDGDFHFSNDDTFWAF